MLPGRRLSLQRHRNRSEYWVVAGGEGRAIIDGNTVAVRQGSIIHVPAGSVHRLENTGSTILEVIEVQLGKCDEADIERLEDDYGRV